MRKVQLLKKGIISTRQWTMSRDSPTPLLSRRLQSNLIVLRGVFRCAAAQQRFVCVLDFCAAARSVPCFGTVTVS